MKNNSSRQFWNPVHRFPNVNVLFFPRPRSGGEFKKWIELPHEITRFPRRRNWTVIGETKRNAWIVQKPLRIGKKWRSAGIIRLSYRATCWPFPFAKGKKKNRKGGNNNWNETCRVSMFRDKTANLLRRYERVYLFSEKKKKKKF